MPSKPPKPDDLPSIPRATRRRLFAATPSCHSFRERRALVADFARFVATRATAPRPRMDDLARAYLIERGDTSTLMELVAKLESGVAALARATGATAEHCRDAIHDVLLEICAGTHSPLATYRGTGSLEGFLRVVVVRRVLRELQRTEAAPPASDPIARRADPGHEVAEGERSRTIRDLVTDALARLDCTERELLLAHVVDGRAISECVDRLGLGRGTGGHRRMHASRLYARVAQRFRAALLRVARTRGWTSADLEDLLRKESPDSTLRGASTTHQYRMP